MNDATITDESDEEPIEVVKSAFTPTRPANVELQEMKRVQAADSTVADRPRVRNELKAPSQRTTRVLSSSPTSTKISNGTIPTHKSVWRPYWHYSASARVFSKSIPRDDGSVEMW